MNTLELSAQVDIFSNSGSCIGGTLPLSQKGKDRLIAIIETLKVLKPKEKTSMDLRWEIWTTLKRPTKEEYVDYWCDFDEDNYGVSAEKQRENLAGYWEEMYPDEEIWYKLSFTVYTGRHQEPFYGVFVNNDYVLSIGDTNEIKTEGQDGEEILSWLEEVVCDAINKAKDGTYNEWLNKNLPYKYRVGSISRKDYFDAYPEERERFREGLTEEEIEAFCKEAKATPEGNESTFLPEMTARTFFEACAVGYKAAGYKWREYKLFDDTKEEQERYGGTTPREWYSKYADGRDDGLTSIPLDDPEIFEAWFNGDEKYCVFTGHHPYEVYSRYSLAHSIHLFPQHTENGWYFSLSGTAVCASTETVKWLNALSKEYPVFLYDGKVTAARFEETDRIAIVSVNDPVDFGDNCYSRVGADIADAIQLPEDYEKVLDKIEWLPETQLCLAEEQ